MKQIIKENKVRQLPDVDKKITVLAAPAHIINNMLFFLFYVVPVCGYAGLIFFFSSQKNPGAYLPKLSHMDFIYHGIEYFVFGILIVRMLYKKIQLSSVFKKNYEYPVPFRIILLSTLAIGLLYGLSDETHQIFVPHRTFSVFDLIADGIGILIACFVYRNFKKI